jgi:chaperonin GroEL
MPSNKFNYPNIKPAKGSHLEMPADLVHQTIYDNVNHLKSEKSDFELPRSNVIANNVHHSAISNALEAISRIIGRTLGPHGSHALISDEFGSHFATKDGYTVLQRLTFVQESTNLVLDLVRSISRAMVRKVGDGSTTAVIMANSLYSALYDLKLPDSYPTGTIQTSLNILSGVLSEAIQEKSHKIIGYEKILQVATIAANNMEEIGKIVAEAYQLGGLSANVFVTFGLTDHTEIKKEPGYRILRGMVNPIFANETELNGSIKDSCYLKQASVLIYGETVDQASFNKKIAPVMNDCITNGKPFVLVAKEYTDDILNIIIEFKKKSPVSILLVDHATATKRGSARLSDLAAILSCQITTFDSAVSLGYVNEVRSTASETVFILESVSPEAEKRATELSEQYTKLDISNDAESIEDDLEELKSRIRSLLGSEVTIFIGGATEQEKKAVKYLVDDAVLAVQAALRSGVVEGLNLTVQRLLYMHGANGLVDHLIYDKLYTLMKDQIPYLTKLNTEILIASLLNAIEVAYQTASFQIFENSKLDGKEIIGECLLKNKTFNVMTNNFETIGNSVINPVETDIEVLCGAISIVNLLIISNQMILTRPSTGGGLD